MNPWYASPEGQKVLSRTEDGKLLFAWRALYDDGNPIYQFEEHIMLHMMNDGDFIPDISLALSTNHLDRERVCLFSLLPNAFAKIHTPWFNAPMDCFVHLNEGERIIANWLTDVSPTSGIRISRSVVGIEDIKTGRKFMTVISPSGKVTLSSTTNVSYEGE